MAGEKVPRNCCAALSKSGRGPGRRPYDAERQPPLPRRGPIAENRVPEIEEVLLLDVADLEGGAFLRRDPHPTLSFDYDGGPEQAILGDAGVEVVDLLTP